jgi:hypothetical protein
MGTYFSSTSIADKKNEMQLINTILQVKQQERMHRMQEVWLVRTSWVGAQGYILYTQLKMGRYSWIALIPSLLLWFGSSQLMRRHHFLDVIDGNQMNFLVEKTGLFKTWDNKLATDVVHPNIAHYIRAAKKEQANNASSFTEHFNYDRDSLLRYNDHDKDREIGVEPFSKFKFSCHHCWQYLHPISFENWTSTSCWSWIMAIGGVVAPSASAYLKLELPLSYHPQPHAEDKSRASPPAPDSKSTPPTSRELFKEYKWDTKAESWRSHPALNPNMKNIMPGFGTAVVLFSCYLAIDTITGLYNNGRRDQDKIANNKP